MTLPGILYCSLWTFSVLNMSGQLLSDQSDRSLVNTFSSKGIAYLSCVIRVTDYKCKYFQAIYFAFFTSINVKTQTVKHKIRSSLG